MSEILLLKKQRLLDWIESTDILKAYTTLGNYGPPGLQILTNTRKDKSARTSIRTVVRATVGCPSGFVLLTFLSNRTPDFELDIQLLGIKIFSSYS